MIENNRVQYTAEEREAITVAALARYREWQEQVAAQSAADFAIAAERIGLAGNNREASRLLWEFANTQVNTQGFTETFTPYEDMLEVFNQMIALIQNQGSDS